MRFLIFNIIELAEIPVSILLLRDIKDLNLGNNKISTLKSFETLAKLPNLYSLWLTNNHIKSLPVSIGNLFQLRNLYIEHNELSEIPDEISGMEKVWVLHAGHNLFTELPAAFASMPGLLLLHANNCHIAHIPQRFATKQSQVLGLVLDNNKLSSSEKARWKKIMRRYFLLSME